MMAAASQSQFGFDNLLRTPFWFLSLPQLMQTRPQDIAGIRGELRVAKMRHYFVLPRESIAVLFDDRSQKQPDCSLL